MIHLHDEKNLEKIDNADDPRNGHYSHITKDIDPHLINKISHRPDPAYNTYVDFLIHNKLAQSNPHFPRIYINNTYQNTKSSTDNKKLWRMEKLPYTFMTYLFKMDGNYSMGNIEETEDRMKNLANLYFKDPSKYNQEGLTPKQINQLANDMFDDLKISDLIKLDSWKEALEILYEFFNNHPFSDDFHMNNMMVRTTSYGPQLVITDPVSKESNSQFYA